MADRRSMSRPRLDYPYGIPVPPLGQIIGGYPPVTPPFNPNAGTGLPTWPPQPREPTPEEAAAQQQPPSGNRFVRGMKDPRMAMFLMAMANSLSQPRQFGQTGYGHVGTALTAGYNQLALSQAAQAQAEMARRQEGREDYKLQLEAAKTAGSLKATEAQTEIARGNLDVRKEEARFENAYRNRTLDKEIDRLNNDKIEKDRQYQLEVDKFNELKTRNVSKDILDTAEQRMREKQTDAMVASYRANAAQSYAQAAEARARAGVIKETGTVGRGGAGGKMTPAQWGSLYLREKKAAEEKFLPLSPTPEEIAALQPKIDAEINANMAKIMAMGGETGATAATATGPGASGEGRTVKRSRAIEIAKAAGRDPEAFIRELEAAKVKIEEDVPGPGAPASKAGVSLGQATTWSLF